ncbi:MAG: phosphoribosyltransferase [Burkholderiaceae bacterium]|nr:phosphoribosyltransferase [Burkholderiaceae bacterium]
MGNNSAGESGSRQLLYSTSQLSAVVETMARRAYGILAGSTKVAIVGVLRRGAPLADMLTELLVQKYSMGRPLRIDIAVKRYADDLTLLYPETRIEEPHELTSVDLTGYHVLIVDDVIHGGYSLLRVVEMLTRKMPAKIRVACLVDRGISVLPIRSDVTGLVLQIAPQDLIEVNVPPYEPVFQCVLNKRPNGV